MKNQVLEPKRKALAATKASQKMAVKKQPRKHDYSNSRRSQQQRLLFHFHDVKPNITAMEARDVYGIYHPSGRIMELREQGWDIKTSWIYEPDKNGVQHRVGLWSYHGENKEVDHALS